MKIGITWLYFQTFQLYFQTIQPMELSQMVLTEFSLHAWKLWVVVFVLLSLLSSKDKTEIIFFFLSSHRPKSGRTWILSAVRRFTVKPQVFALVIEQPYAQLSAVPFCTSDQAAYVSTSKLSLLARVYISSDTVRTSDLFSFCSFHYSQIKYMQLPVVSKKLITEDAMSQDENKKLSYTLFILPLWLQDYVSVMRAQSTGFHKVGCADTHQELQQSRQRAISPIFSVVLCTWSTHG